jgi:hypothetical protein
LTAGGKTARLLGIRGGARSGLQPGEIVSTLIPMLKIAGVALVAVLSACSLYDGDDGGEVGPDAAVNLDAARWSPTWSEIACVAACEPGEGLSACGDESECRSGCERMGGGAWCPCPDGAACDPVAALCNWLCDESRALCAGADVGTCVASCVSGAEEPDGLCTGRL